MTTKNKWKWYCGGGVVAIAVVLGCATAVEFKDSGREAGAKSPAAGEAKRVKRGVAAVPGEEEAHNGGKPRMPIEASFDDFKNSTVVTSDRDVVIVLSPGADITNVSGSVVGLDGLKDKVNVTSLGLTALSSGKPEQITVRVPAISGSLVVTVTGQVAGAWMSESLELKINPKSVSAKSLKQRAFSTTQSRDMGGAVERDATGQVVQPMSATESR